MTVTFAEKLARIPHYEPGTSLEDAKERAETADAVKLASNESPAAAPPGGGRGHRRGGGRRQPLSRPRGAAAAQANRRALRDRSGPRRRLQRLLRVAPGRVRGAVRARLGDRLRMAVVLDVPAHGGALGCARDPRAAGRGLGPRPRRDAGGGHRRDPDRRRLQPQQPDRDVSAGRAHRRLRRGRAQPRHRDRRRGLHRVPGGRPPRRHHRPAGRPPQPGPAAHLQQGATASPDCASATASARRSCAPRWTPCASRSAST